MKACIFIAFICQCVKTLKLKSVKADKTLDTDLSDTFANMHGHSSKERMQDDHKQHDLFSGHSEIEKSFGETTMKSGIHTILDAGEEIRSELTSAMRNKLERAVRDPAQKIVEFPQSTAAMFLEILNATEKVDKGMLEVHDAQHQKQGKDHPKHLITRDLLDSKPKHGMSASPTPAPTFMATPTAEPGEPDVPTPAPTYFVPPSKFGISVSTHTHSECKDECQKIGMSHHCIRSPEKNVEALAFLSSLGGQEAMSATIDSSGIWIRNSQAQDDGKIHCYGLGLEANFDHFGNKSGTWNPWNDGEPNGDDDGWDIARGVMIRDPWTRDGKWNDHAASTTKHCLCSTDPVLVKNTGPGECTKSCKAQGLTFACISSEEENAQVAHLLRSTSYPFIQIDGTDADAEDAGNTGQAKQWPCKSSGKTRPTHYMNWAPGEPRAQNSSENDCLVMFPHGQWDDFPCTPHAFIPPCVCAHQEFEITKVKQAWGSCADACYNEFGMSPACINSAGEDAFVEQLMLDRGSTADQNGTSRVWFGASDNVSSDNSAWTCNGDPVSTNAHPVSSHGFHNWDDHSGTSWEPNGPTEDCAEKYGAEYSGSDHFGKWNDAPCSNDHNCLCAKTGVGWNEPKKPAKEVNITSGFYAQESCSAACFQEYKMSFACIESEAEDRKLYAMMVERGLSTAWWGATDNVTTDNSEWTCNGAPLAYLNWDDGEPNGSHEDCAVKKTDRINDAGPEIPGAWNDAPCDPATRSEPCICSRPCKLLNPATCVI